MRFLCILQTTSDWSKVWNIWGKVAVNISNPPWVGAFWYGQPQEIAQWTPALGCKIVWQKGNAMYINLLNKPFIYKQDSLQNGSTNLLNKPLWQSGPRGDQLELFSSPGFKNIFTKTNWIVTSATSATQSLNSLSDSSGPPSMAPVMEDCSDFQFFVHRCESFYSSTHPWKRFCSLGGVESPGRQPCHEHMVAFCQSWESMFSFFHILQSIFL